jgi:hypothetical protein
VYAEEGIERIEWLASMDADTRESHAVMDGKTVEVGKDFNVPAFDDIASDSMEYPGGGNVAGQNCNCFLPDAVPHGNFEAALKSFYSGKIVIIKTASGKRLPVTVNHPIMTSSGWVKAGSLKKGMDTFTYSADIGNGSLSNPDNKDSPATISQIFNALRANGTISTRGVGLDFNGDGPTDNSDIEIVTIDRVLPLYDEAGVSKLADNLKLILPASCGDALVSGKCASDHLCVTAPFPSDGIMSSGDLCGSLGGVFLHGSPFNALGLGRPSKWNPGFNKMPHESDSDGTALLGKLIEASSCEITTDKIIEIIEDDFTGHVYDLQSIDGYIMCNGILSSNCRCTILPVIER